MFKMKTLHLTLLVFVQVLLASLIFYTNLTAASPLELSKVNPSSSLQQQQQTKVVEQAPAEVKGQEQQHLAELQKVHSKAEATKSAPTPQLEQRDTKTPEVQATKTQQRAISPAAAIKGQQQQVQQLRKEDTKTVQQPVRSEETKGGQQQQLQVQEVRREDVKTVQQPQQQQQIRKEETKTVQQPVRSEETKGGQQQQQVQEVRREDVKTVQQQVRKEETKTVQQPVKRDETKTVQQAVRSEETKGVHHPVRSEESKSVQRYEETKGAQHLVKSEETKSVQQPVRKEETKTVQHPVRSEETKTLQQQHQEVRRDDVKTVQQPFFRREEVKGAQQAEHQYQSHLVRREDTKGQVQQQLQQQVIRRDEPVKSAQVRMPKQEESAGEPQKYFDQEKKLVPEQELVAAVAPSPVAPEKVGEAQIEAKTADDDKLTEKQYGPNGPYRPNGGYGSYGNNGYGNNGYGNNGYGNNGYGNNGYGNGGGGQQVIVAPPGSQVTVITNGNGPNQPPYRPYKSDEPAANVASAAVQQPAAPVASSVVEKQSATPALVVKGGLGPLHLLAATLCGYQPDKPTGDEAVNALYARRVAVRKSLFDFMSLKFTNLERFSSRLNSGVALEVVPPKSAVEAAAAGASPTHGWPVVGKCTAHDLKLMAEAAWCECTDESGCKASAPVAAGASAQPPVESVVQAAPPAPAPAPAPVVPVSSTSSFDQQEPKITSNQHMRSLSARSVRSADSQQPEVAPAPLAAPVSTIVLPDQQPAADKSAIISKLMRVVDVKEAPVVESTIASLNLTQQQLAAVQASVLARACRKNALRMTKALFEHLAEDQRVESSSWPKLYSQMAADECARKRMIDIVSALSGYRTEATTIRRDNVEFAFAMDDLRTKVLESELTAPLTFDKQFIEVGQFLQQSVKLMISNIDPDKAALAKLRYRSLMAGPVSADDQCIELHQRLLAKNYPTDCNPTQFGQLPDVLRMAASSLELWSIESELARLTNVKSQHQQQHSAGFVESKQEVNECIANLVSY